MRGNMCEEEWGERQEVRGQRDLDRTGKPVSSRDPCMRRWRVMHTTCMRHNTSRGPRHGMAHTQGLEEEGHVVTTRIHAPNNPPRRCL